MAAKRPKKLLMIGLDGFMMEPIQKFVSEGLMPNMARLMSEGATSKALPSMPVDTPTNWTTIATGVDTATHGKTSFFVHLPGRELDDYTINESWLSNLCQVETLWEAAERQGKKAIVINYPVAWPPNITDGIVVGGAGVFGESDMFIAGRVQWSTDPLQSERSIAFKDARDWQGLPSSRKPALEARIEIGAGGEQLTWTDGGQKRLGDGDSQEAAGHTHYDLALVARGENGYDTLLVCLDKDASEPIATLAPGQWTDWIYGTFGQERRRGAFRFKLVELAGDASAFRLYRTPIAALEHFAHPESLCPEIVENLGPFLKGLDVVYNAVVWGSRETAQDHIRMGVDQYVRLTNYLAKAKPWDVLITQIQFPDHINHEYIRDIEPSMPPHDAQRAEIAWDQYRQAYTQADRYVGEIMDACADDDTLVVVLSDHAAFPMNWNCNNLYKAFVDAGILAYTKNDQGHYVVDWSETRACPCPGGHYYAWVNLKGRDPQGIVAPGEEYEQVRTEIIEMLRGLYDENTGKHPIALALRREDAAVIGQGGERCGDVVFFYEKGYDTDYVPPDPTVDPSTIPVFGPYHHDHTGGHSPSFPTTAYDHSSLAAVFFMTGPGVKPGVHREAPIHLKDVAPTVCHLLGLDPPEASEGRVVTEFLT